MRKGFLGFTGVAFALLAIDPAFAATAKREAAGTLPDGSAVEVVTLTGANGVSVKILTYGATLQTLSAPDRSGQFADICLGHDDAVSYVTKPNFWGQTVGRYANRIRGGSFTLDGKTYKLATNDGPNALHGGRAGFDKRSWTVEEGDGAGH